MTKTEWRNAYISRMVSRGVDMGDAIANFEAVGLGSFGFDLTQSPEEAADAEMECWDNDEGQP